MLVVWQLRLAWDMEVRIIPMEDTAIPTDAPKDYLDTDMVMESASVRLMPMDMDILLLLIMDMELPAMKPEALKDYLDMDTDMESERGLLMLSQVLVME